MAGRMARAGTLGIPRSIIRGSVIRGFVVWSKLQLRPVRRLGAIGARRCVAGLTIGAIAAAGRALATFGRAIAAAGCRSCAMPNGPAGGAAARSVAVGGFHSRDGIAVATLIANPVGYLCSGFVDKWRHMAIVRRRTVSPTDAWRGARVAKGGGL